MKGMLMLSASHLYSLPKFNVVIDYIRKSSSQIALTQMPSELGKVIDNALSNLEFSFIEEDQGVQAKKKWFDTISDIVCDMLSNELLNAQQESLAKEVLKMRKKWESFSIAGELIANTVLIRYVNPTDEYNKFRDEFIKFIEDLSKHESLSKKVD